MAIESTESISGPSAAAPQTTAVLANYRKYSDQYVDPGHSLTAILDTVTPFKPDFYSRNTMQIWDVSNALTYLIAIWVGATLKNRTIHEIFIVNNSNTDSKVTFSDNYLLVDEEEGLPTHQQITTVPKNSTAHYYCTAVLEKGNLYLHLRIGSQDNRKKVVPFF